MEQGRMWMQQTTLHCTRSEETTGPDEQCIFTYEATDLIEENES
jgi:hypothetical protein